MRKWSVLGLLAGCAAGDDGGATSAEGCVTVGHPLRFQCSADVGADTEVTWQLFEDDTLVRTLSSVGPDQTLWGMAPERTYTWTAESDEGMETGWVSTGSLADGVESLSISVSGASPDVDGFLFPASCGGFGGVVMVDGDGEVVWYEDLGGDVGGFDWSARGVAAAIDRTTVVEVAPDGTVLRERSGFDRPLHHDVATDGDRIWLLNADVHDGYVLDGFYVIDEAGDLEATWDLADYVTPSGGNNNDRFWTDEFPGSTDWSHGNSLEVGPDGTGLLSLRWQDAVLQVVIDPDAVDYGDIEWSITGTSTTSWPSDFTWTDGGGFDGQHHAMWTPEGDLSVFDNGTSVSRALVIDVGADTVAEAASYSMGQRCNVQGSAYVRDDGVMIATCPTSGTVQAFEEDASSAFWSLQVGCSGGGGGVDSMMSRAMPIDW